MAFKFSLPHPAAGLAAACLFAACAPLGAQTPATAPSPSAGLSTLEQPADPAGPTLTLDELLRTVLAYNTELRAAQQARGTATAAIQSASTWSNPRLEWSAGRNQARLPSVNPGQVQGWGIAQFIENPTVRAARIDAARALEQGVVHQITQARNALVAQTKQRAYEYQLRRAEASAGSDAVALLEQVRERVRLRVASGEAPRYEIIKADAEIINARQRQQTATLQAEQALVELNRLAAGRLPARWSLSGTLSDATALPPLEELQRGAQAENPELRALQAEVDKARAQLQAARGSRLPGVELRYSQTRDPEIRQNMLGVSVQIPLLDQRSGPIAEADSELARLSGRLEGRQAELRQQMLLAWKSLDMARVQADALSQGAVREAEAALRVAQAAYRFGERGILDVLDAQRVLRAVRADLLHARYQIQLALIELEYLAGRYTTAPLTPP
ncbi:MAG: TolC family protein [Burkholderiaceae bacterium]|nr:TolC family protein [Burkholderiaceae bacterium]